MNTLVIALFESLICSCLQVQIYITVWCAITISAQRGENYLLQAIQILRKLAYNSLDSNCAMVSVLFVATTPTSTIHIHSPFSVLYLSVLLTCFCVTYSIFSPLSTKTICKYQSTISYKNKVSVSFYKPKILASPEVATRTATWLTRPTLHTHRSVWSIKFKIAQT